MSIKLPESELNPKPGNLIDLAGKRFSRLLVQYRNGTHTKGEAKWHCICNCGKEKDIVGHCLRSGATKSCGCLQKELIGNRARKHGLSGDTKYKLWRAAKLRARKANIPFNISLEDLPEVPDKCPILGTLLEGPKRRGFCPNSPSIDRIVPKEGYVKGNVRIISHRANQLKSDATPEEILLLAEDANKRRS